MKSEKTENLSAKKGLLYNHNKTPLHRLVIFLRVVLVFMAFEAERLFHSLDRALRTMDQLIPIINKLQDVFNTLEQDPVDLPQIVVRDFSRR
jgi:hypothetical protein